MSVVGYLLAVLLHLVAAAPSVAIASTISDRAAGGHATAASEFLRTIGVNTHLGYRDTSYKNLGVVQSSLDYLGIRLVRDTIQNARTAQEIAMLGQAGFRFDILIEQSEHAGGIAWQLEETARLARYIDSVEGPNEVNMWPVTYNGLSGYAAATAIQQAIYGFVADDQALRINGKTVPVLSYTLGNGSSAAFRRIGNLASAATRGNAHIYFTQGEPPRARLITQVHLQGSDTPGLPMIVTETGYYNAPFADLKWGGVDDWLQGIYTLDILLDAYRLGVQQTYLYELMDERSDPNGRNREAHFGLFNMNGVPKPAATAIHNLTALLRGHGTGPKLTSNTMPYEINGLPLTGATLLLRQKDGSFWLVIWYEPKLWNPFTHQRRQVGAIPLSISLDQPVESMFLYDPFRSARQIMEFDGVSRFQIDLPDHPLLLQIIPRMARR